VVGVIDDDPSVRSALLRLFRTAGFEVSLFANAEEYLSHPRRAGVECLVIDVRLPGMDGLQLYERLRMERAMPTLLISAHEDREAQSRALAAGAVGFFLKPFDNRQLLAAVHRALGGEP
jgi:FixJ family two-component response regulator